MTLRSDQSVTLQRGARLGPYEIVSFLGAGGMGEVYRARDTRLLRDVAIKVLPAEIALDRERLKRFEREARAASALNHPNIVTIYDIGSSDGISYIAMELVEGDSLRKMLVGGALAIKRLLPIATQIAQGLARAHEAGIVHRDLKPENLIVGKDGIVKILDFGLAKTRVNAAGKDHTSTPTETATEVGAVLGTVGYMSPEQVAGIEIDHRSDQFSLGAVLYEMATGRRAFQKKTAVDTMSAILNEDPQPIVAANPQIPVALRWIIERCLAKSHEDRYDSTRDLARDFATLRDRTPDSGIWRPTSALEHRRSLSVVLVALAAGLAILAGTYLVGERRGKSRVAVPTFHQLTFRRGGIQSARFTSDGRTVVLSASWDGDPLRLYSTRIESPGSVSLGLPDADLGAVSSSAELLVLLGRPFDSLNWPDLATLARVPLTGGTPRVLAERVQFADWGPDAKGVAAVLSDVDGNRRLEYPIGKVLLKAGIPGGRTTVYSPRVSRDGRRVAYYRFDPDEAATGPLRVEVADLSGHTRVLTSGWKDVGMYLAWSPRGDEVWFTGSKAGYLASLCAVSLDGRESVLLRLPGWINLQDISPDGRVLLSFGKNNMRIRCRLAGWERERDLSWFDHSDLMDLSADGSSLLFAERGETTAVRTAYLRSTDGSPPQRLGEFEPIGLSPDGARVVAWDPMEQEYVVLPVGPGEPRYLPANPGWFYASVYRWFADDRRLLALMKKKGEERFRTFAVDVDGGTFEPLAPEGYRCYFLAPDEKRAVCRTTDSGEPSLFTFGQEELHEIPGIEDADRLVQWSDDGEYLFVQSETNAARIERLELATGKREVWRELGPLEPAGLGQRGPWANLTPDGRSYCYCALHLPSDLYLVDGLR